MKDKEEIRKSKDEEIFGLPDYEPAGCKTKVVYPTVGTTISTKGMEFEDILERQDGHPTLQTITVGTEERH